MVETKQNDRPMATALSWNGPALAPTGLLVARLALFGMRFLPLRDRLVLVVVHLLVHANAIGSDDLRCRSRLIPVVLNARVDPFNVIGIHVLRRHGGGRQTQSQQQSSQNALHG